MTVDNSCAYKMSALTCFLLFSFLKLSSSPKTLSFVNICVIITSNVSNQIILVLVYCHGPVTLL